MRCVSCKGIGERRTQDAGPQGAKRLKPKAPKLKNRHSERSAAQSKNPTRASQHNCSGRKPCLYVPEYSGVDAHPEMSHTQITHMSRRRLGWVAHHSLEELEWGYRGCKEGIERSHWQMVWLYKQHGVESIAQMMGYTARWVRTIIKRYNQAGAEGLKDQRHENPGNPRLLSPAQEAEGLSLWTGPKVAAWMSDTNFRRRVFIVAASRSQRQPRWIRDAARGECGVGLGWPGGCRGRQKSGGRRPCGGGHGGLGGGELGGVG